MKIGVVSTPVFAVPVSGYSGLECLAWHQAKGLAELGNEVFLFAPDGSTCSGVTVIPFGPEGNWNEKQAYGRYWQHLLNLDCVIDNTWNKWSYCLKAEGRLKSPVLAVMHAPVNTMVGSLPPMVDKPCFVCISHDQANHLKALYNWNSRVAHNGVDTDFYKPLNIPRTDRFLFLARFSTIKGPDIAIEACLEAGVGLDLIGDTKITGEPEYFHKCMTMAEQSSPGWDHKKGKQIRVLGGVSRAETVYWYSQAFCMLHPNLRFREPFGLAPVESMLCGCPVIAFDHGAMRETVKNFVVGRIINTIDEFKQQVKLANSVDVPKGETCADSWRKSCRNWAEQFSMTNMVKRYNELCQEAVETGGW